jgi:hypothetical protein
VEAIAVPLWMRAVSNPCGPGHGFIKQRFLVEQPADRLVIPTRLTDNPHLDVEEYKASLDQHDSLTRAQPLEGDWSEYSGGFFRREWFVTLDQPPRS